MATALLATGACTVDSSERPLTVFAASSMTEVMQELALAFERERAGTRVRFNHAGSQVLRLQIERGAAADVFVSANREHAESLAGAGFADRVTPVAHNELVLVVPLENPAGLNTFADLVRADRIVIADPAVPAGQYTAALLSRAEEVMAESFGTRVLARVVSRENNVRLARAKVELGEADAAIIYRSDALSGARVRAIEIPLDVNVRAEYVAAVISDSSHHEQARAFVEFMLSVGGQAIFERHGFSAGVAS